MVTDSIMSRFADMDVPGRRKPINRDVVILKDETPWDDKPVHYMVKGVQREFFTIRHVAMAFGRSAQSIRSWENQGTLPKSPYRSPKPRKEQVPGAAIKGRRLWTREQIEGMVQIAKEMGLIFPRGNAKLGKAPTRAYAIKVNKLFADLLAQQQS